MDATLEPARRIISRLLQEDARFFQEYHYLNPFDVDVMRGDLLGVAQSSRIHEIWGGKRG
jgi:hypothetical protein